MGKSLIDTELQFHLKIKSGDVGKYVILTGDPDRVAKIASYLDNSTQIAKNREFTTYSGYLNDVKVSVTSTGIGGASSAIAVEELVKCGSDTFIRVGTSGGMADKVLGGDIVVATAAIRSEGTSLEYIPVEYPAVADYEVVKALEMAAEELSTNQKGNKYHIGVIHSKDSFYGETNPETMVTQNMLESRWSQYLKCGCLTSEMECASIFSVAIVRNVRAGAVLTALWNVQRAKTNIDNLMCDSSERAIKCAILAIKKLIEKDNR